MKLHQTAVVTGVGTETESVAVGGFSNRTQTAFNANRLKWSARNEPDLAPANGAWTHTLILTGELDRSSAHALEVAIERLCEEGVTGIRLDLRKLTYIDWIGVAVIAFRCGLCQRRGYDFALIPGSQRIQRVFEQTGVAELLPFQADEIEPPRPPALALALRRLSGEHAEESGGSG